MRGTTRFFLLIILILSVSLLSNFSTSLRIDEVIDPIEKVVLSDIEFGSLIEDEYDMYNFVVLNTATQLSLSLSGPSGADFDLYLRLNLQPTLYTYDYSSESLSSDEAIAVSNPTAGIWYVMVYAYSGSGSYSLTLDVNYPEPEPEPVPTTSTSTPTPSPTSSTQTTTSNSEIQSPNFNTNLMLIFGAFILGVIGFLWVVNTRSKPKNATVQRSQFFGQNNFGIEKRTETPSSYSEQTDSVIEQEFSRGFVYYISGDYERASLAMIHVLRMNPNHERAKTILMNSIQKLKDKKT